MKTYEESVNYVASSLVSMYAAANSVKDGELILKTQEELLTNIYGISGGVVRRDINNKVRKLVKK